MRRMAIVASALVQVCCAPSASPSWSTWQVPHYDILIPVHRVSQDGHFVIRTRREFVRLQESFGGRAWWDSLEIVSPDFGQSMVVGLAMQQSGCGPQSLVRRIVLERDTLQVHLERSDILGPCDTLFSWIEMAVIARHDDRVVVFVSPDSQWAKVPYVERDIGTP